jgi:hypothetical protein
MYDRNELMMYKMKGSPLKKQKLSPGAAKAKAERDLRYANSPARKAKRADSQAQRRAAKNGRDVAGKDFDHRTNSFVDVSTNRGNRGEGTKKEGSANYKVTRRNG